MKDLKNLDCLLPDTQKVLLKIISSCPFLRNYVLVGGSALALHLNHRQSEDLDFFTYANSFSKNEIFEFITAFDSKEILNQTDGQVDVLLDGVKVTFFNAKWNFLSPLRVEQFNLATVEQIAAMKVNVLFLRAKYRDYYDLYFLSKELMSVSEIFKYSQDIAEGLTFKLFAVSLVYIDDIEDDNISYLAPKEKIAKEKIRDFFEARLSRIKQ